MGPVDEVLQTKLASKTQVCYNIVYNFNLIINNFS